MMIPGRNAISFCLSAFSALLLLASCVNENSYLGYGLVPSEEQFVTRTVKLPIPNVYLASIDSMTGYNSSRLVIGSIRDTTFGITRRGSAVALVPVSDTINWGHNVKVRGFHLAASLDSISCRGSYDASMIQQLRVYQMIRPIDSTLRYSCELRNRDFEGQPSICKGVPTLNGSDSLSIDFLTDFAETYVPKEAFSGTSDVVQIMTADSIDVYTNRHPGIYVCSDDPLGYGGRINFFDVNLSYEDDYYLTSYAALSITADYGSRKQIDTTIIFTFTPTDFENEGTNYAFNTCETEYIPGKTFGEATLLHGSVPAFRTGAVINVEGGTGYKPVILAGELRSAFVEAIKDTIYKYRRESPDVVFKSKQLVVNKATLSIFYDMPEDYTDMTFYPQVLNPTLRINDVKKDTVSYGSITDSSVSDENQGDVDRANCCYRPDITHHFQETLLLSPEDSTDLVYINRKDIWLLILASETIVVDSSSSSDSDYYTQMAYLNYYNSMLSGSYGSDYSNYYNYYMMQSYYSSLSSGSSTTVVQTLDTDRYYNAVLKGPGAGSEFPTLEVTYSFLRKSE